MKRCNAGTKHYLTAGLGEQVHSTSLVLLLSTYTDYIDDQAYCCHFTFSQVKHHLTLSFDEQAHTTGPSHFTGHRGKGLWYNKYNAFSLVPQELNIHVILSTLPLLTQSLYE